MDNIIEPTINYDFSNLYLGPPSTLAGGTYFTKIMYSNNKLLYIQTPKSLTKQGFVKSGKKIFTDLMFDNNDTVFVNWIENLETKCQELLFSKGETWFQTKLEKDDIESAFTSALKIYKSGKYYLLRVNVKPNIKIFNESNNVVSLEEITTDKNIISILEIQGIKFTSRNFQIEIELKQSLIVSPDPFLDGFFIKKPATISNQVSTPPVLSNLIVEPIKNEVIIKNNIGKQEKDKEKEEEKETMSINLDEFIKSSVNDINNVSSGTTLNAVNLTEVDPFINDNNNDNDNNNNDKNDLPEKIKCISDSENIALEIEDLDLDMNKDLEVNEDPNLLKEVNFNSSLVNSLDTFTLKKPNQVYQEILNKAREKAREAKKQALQAYLELKEIKKTYMIDDMDDSDSELDDYSDEDKDENEDDDE
jgi:hypothetical protein